VTFVQPYLKRPRLRVVPYEPEEGDCARFPASAARAETEAATWVRLKLSNERRTAAEDVEVVVANVRGLDPDRQGLPALHLNDDRSLGWSDRATDRVGIPGGVSRRFDLLCLSPRSAHTELAFHDTPDDRRHELPAGEYVITVCATARNAQPVFQSLALTIPENWKPGETLDELRLVVGRSRSRSVRKAGVRFAW